MRELRAGIVAVEVGCRWCAAWPNNPLSVRYCFLVSRKAQLSRHYGKARSFHNARNQYRKAPRLDSGRRFRRVRKNKRRFKTILLLSGRAANRHRALQIRDHRDYYCDYIPSRILSDRYVCVDPSPTSQNLHLSNFLKANPHYFSSAPFYYQQLFVI